jgi:hypothetical protein
MSKMFSVLEGTRNASPQNTLTILNMIFTIVFHINNYKSTNTTMFICIYGRIRQSEMKP